MDKDAIKTTSVGLPANGTGNREACPKRWYVAQVRNCCERKVAKKINSLGIEAFAPIQKEIHYWSDRKKVIDRIVIPMVVFVKMSNEDIRVVRDLSFVYTLLKAPGAREYAVIPDKQIEDFCRMLAQHDEAVTMDSSKLVAGTEVEVVRGSMKGMVGKVAELGVKKTRVYVNLGFLGSANVLIDIADVKCISKTNN